MTLKALCKAVGISRNTAKKRLREGWTTEEIERFYKSNKRVYQSIDENIDELFKRIVKPLGMTFTELLQSLEFNGDSVDVMVSELGISNHEFKLMCKKYALQWYFKHEDEIEKLQE
jgi:hypothetical protein